MAMSCKRNVCRPHGQRIGLLFATVVIVLVVGAFLSVQGTLSLIDAGHWVVHSLEVQRELGQTHIALQNAEAAQRTYLILDNEAYLQQFDLEVQNVHAELGTCGK